MARKKERFDLKKVTVKLFEGDFEAMQDLYPKSGANKIIREMIHRHIAVCKELAQKNQGALAQLDIDISDDEVSQL